MAGLLTRLKAAASFANVGRQIAMGTFDASAAQNAFGILQGIYPASRGEPPQRGTQERLQAYSDMPWLRACAERVAVACASVQWQLFIQRSKKTGKVVRNKSLQYGDYKTRQLLRKELDKTEALTEVESHPFLDQVIESGNSFMTGHAMRKVTFLHVDLAGEAFWLKERDRLGTVIGVWPVPPHWILGTPTPTHQFYRVGYRAWVGDIPATEMLWMPNPDPKFPYGRGSGLAGALADELETDEYASRFLKQYFYNDATPPFMVSPKGDGPNNVLSEAEARNLEYRWLSKLQGYWKAHKPLFTNRAVDVFEFKRDLRSMQMVPLREHERDVVMNVYGLPPEILGVLTHSNRATIDAADYIMGRFVTIPRLEFFRAYLQEKLIPEYDPRFILDYVSPIAEDHASQLDAAKAAPWALTLNEWRARMGEPPEPDGDVRLVPFTLQATSSIADLQNKPTDPLAENPTEVIPPETAA